MIHKKIGTFVQFEELEEAWEYQQFFVTSQITHAQISEHTKADIIRVRVQLFIVLHVTQTSAYTVKQEKTIKLLSLVDSSSMKIWDLSILCQTIDIT